MKRILLGGFAVVVVGLYIFAEMAHPDFTVIQGVQWFSNTLATVPFPDLMPTK